MFTRWGDAVPPLAAGSTTTILSSRTVRGWDDVALKSAYAALGLLTTLAAIVNGSLGGEAGLLGTALAEVWDFFGTDLSNPMVLSTAGGVTVLAVVLVAIAGVASFVTLRP